MKGPSPSSSSHSWLSLGSIVSPLVGVVVAGDSGAAAGVSGPVAEVLGASARAFCASPVLVPVVGFEPRQEWQCQYREGPEKKKDVILARGAAAAGTGGVRAAGSIGPL